MKIGLPAIFSFIVYFYSNIAAAQSRQEDSILYQASISNTLSIYYGRLGDQSPIFNGSHYVTSGNEFKTGSPYFLSGSFTSNSSVIYDGIQFDSLTLLYEDLRELIVSKNNNYLLQLSNQRIYSFSISGHRFIRLVADSLNTGIPKTGFYEILYQGHSLLLKKTLKSIAEEATINEGVLKHIEVSYQYFIKKGNKYLRVKSKRELLDILNDRQKDIQHFIKKNKLNFRKDKENTLIQVAGYYDQITN
ncbi:MAG TPA: hypothetical protein VII44_06580 [Puia sp.]